MKNLVTITGTPATAPMVAKEIALQLGKVAVFWIASYAVNKAVFSAMANQSPKIDWNHPAFK